MRSRLAGNRHARVRAERFSMIIYGLVTIAAFASVVGIVMCWGTMVEEKLVGSPERR